MASLAQIRDAVRTVLVAADDRLNVYPRFSSQLVLPCVVIAPDDADYDQVFGRAHMTWNLNLYVLAQSTVNELGQYDIDEYIDIDGPRSIVKALYGEDLELAGTQVHVASMSSYGTFEAAGVEHIGAVLSLTVHTPGALS